jgi:hypothetical protein
MYLRRAGEYYSDIVRTYGIRRAETENANIKKTRTSFLFQNNGINLTLADLMDDLFPVTYFRK